MLLISCPEKTGQTIEEQSPCDMGDADNVLIANGGHAGGDGHLRKVLTSSKRIDAHIGHSIWNRHVRQVIAIRECAVTNGCHA